NIGVAARARAVRGSRNCHRQFLCARSTLTYLFQSKKLTHFFSGYVWESPREHARSGAVEIATGNFFVPVRLSHTYSKVKSSPDGELFTLERVGGVEPPFRPWQGRIIAAIRYPRTFSSI
ncbi:MAG: hypothetical protein QG607_327, partial [Patescibacteria group bacterium]|nr:hypothetical protein [Patescibacteria group bacterium]